jgi:hypothetical protein
MELKFAGLAGHLFSQSRWDVGEFIGYRCEERWPLWNCDYVMALEYRPIHDTQLPS